jgi:two-component system response regulator AtoC
MGKILIVDDEKMIRIVLSKVLSKAGYEIFEAENGKEALEKYEQYKPDLVLLDFQLPGMDGLEVLEELKEDNESLIVIMLTAYGNIKNAVHAMKLGAYDYLAKPFDNEEIVLVIQKAFQTMNLGKEVKFLKEKLNEKNIFKTIIGESPEMKKVLEQVRLVAKTDVTVLIEGETGTGKELVAKLIHQDSLRKNNPFIAVDCGAIPDTLFESELFGFEKGAFTGAVRSQIGKFEQANNGTLFLDEINNLPFNMQAKLLRVIEEKSMNKLGGRNDIKINVRIIVASNCNIIENVKKGNFRSDLYYRLNEFKIDIPTVADRKDDIPLLASYFLNQANKQFSKTINGFAPNVLRVLLRYSWPGNIRELKNVINRAVILATEDHITLDELMLGEISSNVRYKGNTTLVDATHEAEIDTIKKALKKANGNKAETAKILGISRRNLYRKLNKFDLL